MNLEIINATDLSDAWHQLVYRCLKNGRKYKIDEGSYKGTHRLELDCVVLHIKMPWVEPLLPKLNPDLNIPDPVDDDYLIDYLPYLMTDQENPNEQYTYGQRLTGEFDVIAGKECRIDQIDNAILTYRDFGFHNNQMCLQVAKPTDIMLTDPPCLRSIDTKIIDGKLNFYLYFRSWDAWGGFPANMAAIELLKQFMASEIGVDNGEMIAISKGAHLYEYVWESAEIVRGRTRDELIKEK